MKATVQLYLAPAGAPGPPAEGGTGRARRWAVGPLILALVLAGALIAQPNGDPPERDAEGGPGAASPPRDPIAAFMEAHEVYQGSDVGEGIRAAQLALARGDYPTAIDRLEAVQALSENHPVIRHMLGLARLADGRYEQALRDLRRSFRELPGWRFVKLPEAWLDPSDRATAARIRQVRAELQAALDPAAPAPVGREDGGAPAAGEVGAAGARFLLGYLAYVLEELEIARDFFQALALAEPPDPLAMAFLEALAARGMEDAIPTPPAPPTTALRADQAWLLPGLRQFADGAPQRAAVTFGLHGMRQVDPEAYLWMAVALLADEQPIHAGQMLRRALHAPAEPDTEPVLARPLWRAIVSLPRFADLVPGSSHAALQEAFAARDRASRSPDLRAQLAIGFVAYLDGDRARASARLTSLANHPDTASGEPLVDLRRIARGLLATLSARRGLPPFDLEAVVRNPVRDPDPAGLPDGSDGGGDTGDPNDEPPTARERAAEVLARIQEAVDEGQLAMRRGAFEEAFASFESARRSGEDHSPAYFARADAPEVYLGLARARLALGDYAAAADALVYYLSHEPTAVVRARGLFQTGFPAGSFGRLVERLDAHVAASAPGDDEPRVRFLLGYVRYQQGPAHDHEAVVELTFVAAGSDLGAPFSAVVSILADALAAASDENVEARAVEQLRLGNARLAAGRFVDAEPLIRRAYERLGSTEALTAYVATMLALAGAETGVDARVARYRQLARVWRAFLGARSEVARATLTLDLAGAFGHRDRYAAAARQLVDHVARRPLDYEAAYADGFVRYFAGDAVGALASWSGYLNTRPDPDVDTSALETFIARARQVVDR